VAEARPAERQPAWAIRPQSLGRHGHRHRPGLLILAAALALVHAFAPTARAQTAPDEGGAPPEAAQGALSEEERSARARALFGEGVQHAQAERWTDAAGAFEAALELRSAPAIRYNLAAAYVELGRFRDARAELDRVEADPETSPDIAELSGALAARIRREAGRLSVERAEELVDAQVAVDAEPLAAEWLAREIPVAPGAHVVTARRDGEPVARAEVQVSAGERTHVYLGLGTVPGGPEDPSTPLFEEWGFWAGVGAGVVVLGVLIGVVAAASSGGGGSEPVSGNFMPGVITWP
jgi:hypothetical protein